METRVERLLPRLRALEAVARLGGVGRAAQELGVTHSAVSQAISRLEAVFECELVTSDSAGRRPTRSGRTLAEAYARASEILEAAVGQVRGRGAELGGLVVSLPRSLAGGLLANRLARLHRDVGDVAIEVHDDAAQPRFDRVDVAVLFGAAMGPDLHSELLYTERLTALCSPVFLEEHRLFQAEALQRAPLISSSWRLWLRWFDVAGLTPPRGPALSLADEGLALDAAARGLGAVLGSVPDGRLEIAGGSLLAPFAPVLSTGRKAHLVWPATSRYPASTDRFVAWLLADVRTKDSCDRFQPVDASARPIDASARSARRLDRVALPVPEGVA